MTLSNTPPRNIRFLFVRAQLTPFRVQSLINYYFYWQLYINYAILWALTFHIFRPAGSTLITSLRCRFIYFHNIYSYILLIPPYKLKRYPPKKLVVFSLIQEGHCIFDTIPPPFFPNSYSGNKNILPAIILILLYLWTHNKTSRHIRYISSPDNRLAAILLQVTLHNCALELYLLMFYVNGTWVERSTCVCIANMHTTQTINLGISVITWKDSF